MQVQDRGGALAFLTLNCIIGLLIWTLCLSGGKVYLRWDRRIFLHGFWLSRPPVNIPHSLHLLIAHLKKNPLMTLTQSFVIRLGSGNRWGIFLTPTVYIDSEICVYHAFHAGMDDVVFSQWRKKGLTTIDNLFIDGQFASFQIPPNHTFLKDIYPTVWHEAK